MGNQKTMTTEETEIEELKIKVLTAFSELTPSEQDHFIKFADLLKSSPKFRAALDRLPCADGEAHPSGEDVCALLNSWEDN